MLSPLVCSSGHAVSIADLMPRVLDSFPRDVWLSKVCVLSCWLRSTCSQLADTVRLRPRRVFIMTLRDQSRRIAVTGPAARSSSSRRRERRCRLWTFNGRRNTTARWHVAPGTFSCAASDSIAYRFRQLRHVALVPYSTKPR